MLKTVERKKIIYFSFDEKSANIKDLFKTYETHVLRKKLEDAGKIYVFFDEIQKCDNWENQLKIFYDIYPNIKFFISGSSQLLINKKSKESLVGRVYTFILKPLSFKEFLEYKGIKIKDKKIQERTLSIEFLDYLKKGGFIELVFEKDENVKRYIKENVLERILYKDIPESFGIRDIDLLKTLIEIFSRNSGMILNYDKLARDLGRNKITIMNYISYLEFSMLIKLVKNIRKSLISSSRKLKKVYVTNTAFIYAFEENQMEKILETYVCNFFDLEFYFRNSFELDFIKKDKELAAIEVKSRLSERDIEIIKKNIEKLGIKKAIIITVEQNISSKNVKVVPAYFTDSLFQKKFPKNIN